MILEVQRYTDPIVKITYRYPENQNYHVLGSEREIENDSVSYFLQVIIGKAFDP